MNAQLISDSEHVGLKSAIYTGFVEHSRYSPKSHYFKYKVFMMYLDLDEIDQVFSLSKLWSKVNPWAPAYFKRSDFLGNEMSSLKEEVLGKVFKANM